MADEEWFRRKTWSSSDRIEFYARLKRSRGAFHKAQYARIQAHELFEAGTPETIQGAVELLDLVLAEWHSEAQLAAVYHQYAKCLAHLEDGERALEYYRLVFEEQRRNGGHITSAHLDFGWYCICKHLPGLFAEALGVLDEFQYQPVFPVQIYLDAAIRSLIHDFWQDHERAKAYAVRALGAAEQTRSPLPRHPSLGLVNRVEPDIHRRLAAIAA